MLRRLEREDFVFPDLDPAWAKPRIGVHGASARRVLAMIMAGGKGERLHPLTRERSKPSVPFGAATASSTSSSRTSSTPRCRLALRAGAVQVAVADRAPAAGLAHLRACCPTTSSPSCPPQMRFGPAWYRGHGRRRAAEPQRGGRLQPRRRGDLRRRPHLPDGPEPDAHLPPGVGRRRHGRRAAGAAAGGLAVRRAGGRHRRPRGGLRRRSRPGPRACRATPTRSLVSMGNYFFSRTALVDALLADARRCDRPRLRALDHSRDGAHRTRLRLRLPGQRGPGREAVRGAGLLARRRAPCRRTGTPTWTCSASRRASTSTTATGRSAPGSTSARRRASSGATWTTSTSARPRCVKRATIRNSILGRSVWVNEGAVIEDSIVMDHTTVGKGARLRRAIVDRFNIIPADSEIGVDPAIDRRRHYVDPSGIVVVPRGGRREFLLGLEEF